MTNSKLKVIECDAAATDNNNRDMIPMSAMLRKRCKVTIK